MSNVEDSNSSRNSNNQNKSIRTGSLKSLKNLKSARRSLIKDTLKVPDSDSVPVPKTGKRKYNTLNRSSTLLRRNSIPDPNSPTIQAVIFNAETEEFELNEKDLQDFLFAPNLCDHKVAIISIAGAFRKGKSFILNFFIKYLEYLEKKSGSIDTIDNIIDNDDPSKLLFPDNKSSDTRNIEECNKSHQSYDRRASFSSRASVDSTTLTGGDESDEDFDECIIPEWLSTPTDRINGFRWRGGSERETSGIVIWKKPFFLNTKRHGKIAVLLMDTQGTFDWTSTVKNCATIFALSTMLSSVQIFNLSNNLQEDDLNHLQFFTEYGRLVLEQSEHKPFQKLMFLIRDWSYRYEFDYGFSPEYLDKILQIQPSQPKELQSVRKHIHECFEEISCMLLPYPGTKVATSIKFRGKIEDIEKPFLSHTANLVNHTISMYCRQAKEINGKVLTGSDIFFYFKSYMQAFQCNDMPEPKNILMATGEADHLVATKEAQDYYIKKMYQICGGDKPYMLPNQLNSAHNRIKGKTIKRFEESKKMGSEIYHDEYLSNLEGYIEERFSEMVEANSNKNLLKNVRVFIICIILFLFTLTTSQILDFIGLDFLMFPFVFIARLSLAILIFWTYLRISGHFRSSLVILDDIAEFLWQTVTQVTFDLFLNSNFYPTTKAILDGALSSPMYSSLNKNTTNPGSGAYKTDKLTTSPQHIQNIRKINSSIKKK